MADAIPTTELQEIQSVPRGRGGRLPRDLSNQRFGRLIARSSFRIKDKNGRTRLYWRCDCDCGKTKDVLSGLLKSGPSGTNSCGCLSDENRRSGNANRKHGKSRTPEYIAWQQMRLRCTNPKHRFYKFYGGRGITICERWNLFENFLADMGPRTSPKHSLDRIDNNGNYEPSNCRWATQAEQMRNRSNIRQIEFNGRTMCAEEWAKEIGITGSNLRKRLKKMSVEEALTKPKPAQYRK